MNIIFRHIIHAIVLVLGLALMVVGIITGKHGATFIGIMVAAVNVQVWMRWNKQHSQGDKGK